VKKMIEKFSYEKLEQGDVIITNDPYLGGASKGFLHGLPIQPFVDGG
ncbi:unnamed protein product, partial [marine sediment metagenome]